MRGAIADQEAGKAHFALVQKPIQMLQGSAMSQTELDHPEACMTQPDALKSQSERDLDSLRIVQTEVTAAADAIDFGRLLVL